MKPLNFYFLSRPRPASPTRFLQSIQAGTSEPRFFESRVASLVFFLCTDFFPRPTHTPLRVHLEQEPFLNHLFTLCQYFSLIGRFSYSL